MKNLTFNDKLAIAIVAAAIAITGFIAASFLQIPKVSTSFGDIGGGVNYLQTINTNTGAAIGPQVSVRVISTSTSRLWLRLSNPSSNTVYCNLSDASSSISTGMSIAASSSFTIDANNLYIGSIQCENPTASTTLLITGQQ